MKKHLIVFAVMVGILSGLIGCQPFIENKVIVQNNAAAAVKLLLAGKTYEVLPGEDLIIPDFRKGSFEYSTLYSVPEGTTTYSAQGDVSGTMVFNAGTEILLVYTSTTVTSGTSITYTIFGTLTSSDDINRTDPFAEE